MVWKYRLIGRYLSYENVSITLYFNKNIYYNIGKLWFRFQLMGYGGEFMSKCPFWSSSNERVNCYNECPMHNITNESESCPFKEHLNSSKASMVNSLNEELFYSQERYLNYEEEDKVINY